MFKLSKTSGFFNVLPSSNGGLPWKTLWLSILLANQSMANSLVLPAVDKNLPKQQISSPHLQKLSSPSLYHVMMAEFLVNRGNTQKALAIYKKQAFKENAAPVFERALGLSLVHEEVKQSLNFAHLWQKQYPEHMPALFYTTHLALKANQYELASEKLAQILQYDPNADLNQILLGIYPSHPEDQAELLRTLQNLDTKDNTALLVMMAGLLLQFEQYEQALEKIDKALEKKPNTPAYILLKADILQKLGDQQHVIDFIQQARKNLPDNKSLFLYQARYLIQQNQNIDAWELLIDQQNQIFLQDDEIKLLTALLGIDLQRYLDADVWLKQLTNSRDFKEQAHYYLAVSAERQLKAPDAIYYYGKVMQPNLVLTARKKQMALLLAQYQFDEAIASMIKLRKDFDDFVPQSYIMQASILQKIKQTPAALTLLDTAQKQFPENTDIMFAKVLLLPEQDLLGRQQILQNLLQIAPNHVEYQLEYAQVLVKLKTDSEKVEMMLSALMNDSEVGLRARQILSQQALYQKDYQQIVMLLSDHFDVIPDVVSGLLLQQAYLALNNQPEMERITDILQNELNYALPN